MGWRAGCLFLLFSLLAPSTMTDGSFSSKSTISSDEELRVYGNTKGGSKSKYNYYEAPFLPSYYSQYNDDRVVQDGYYYQPNRMGPYKNFATRSSMQNLHVAPNPYQNYAQPLPVHDIEYGGLASASGHHGQHYGSNQYVSKVDTSAIGLLGLLGLFSLLQNVLRLFTTTTTTTKSGRKKRDASDNEDLTQENNEIEGDELQEKISRLLLPSLNVIAHARSGHVPIECTLREVCSVNMILVRQLGPKGRGVGSMISSAIKSLLKEKKGVPKRFEDVVVVAGLSGRNGEDCNTKYPICPTLFREPSLPLLMTHEELTKKSFP